MYGLSVIIPCYNSGIYLEEAVKSVLNQVCDVKIEVIIIDDCSDDTETLTIINRFKLDERIIVKRNEKNKGVQYSRNIGIKLAQSEFIMTLDSDDCLKMNVIVEGKNYLDYAVKSLKNDKDIVLVHGLSEMFGNYSGYTISSYPISEELAVRKHHIQTSVIYRKIDALSAGLYDERIEKWQDWSFGIALMNNRYKSNLKNKVLFVSNTVHLYRIHKKTERISAKDVSEYEMIYYTVSMNLDIFKAYFPNLSAKEIVLNIISNKPDRLEELLYVARSDIDRALTIIKERNYVLEYNALHEIIP